MSLLVDPDHLIHSLRLAYLKRIDDHYGPRVITFPSIAQSKQDPTASTSTQADDRPSLSNSSSSNSFFASSSTPVSREDVPSHAIASLSLYNPFDADSYVAIAGLNDPARHPELSTIHSPVPTAGDVGPFGGFGRKGGRSGQQRESEAGERSSTGLEDGRKPDGLSYAQTIYGPGRSGALGMRVNGRRASKRVSISAANLPAQATVDKDANATDGFQPKAHDIENEATAAQSGTGGETAADLAQPQDIQSGSLGGTTGERLTEDDADVPFEQAGTVMGRRVNFALPKEHADPSTLDRSPEAETQSGSQSLSPHPHTPAVGRQGSTYAESSTESNTALSSLGSAGSLQDGSLGLTTINSAITGGPPSPHSQASHSRDAILTARPSLSSLAQPWLLSWTALVCRHHQRWSFPAPKAVTRTVMLTSRHEATAERSVARAVD